MAIDLKFLDRFAGMDDAFTPYIKPKVSRKPSRYKTPEEEEEELDLSFLDQFKEEEKEPEKDLSFLDDFSSNPIEEYNTSTYLAETMAKSREENYSRYGELYQKPDRTPEETEEMVAAWKKSHDAELGFYSEQKKLETLRPEVDRVNAERQQVRIDQVESLRLDPVFGDSVADRLYEFDSALQAEMEQARAIPDRADRELAIEGIAKKYNDQETTLIKGAAESYTQRFDLSKQTASLLRQLEVNDKFAIDEYGKEVQEAFGTLPFDIPDRPEGPQLAQEAWQKAKDKQLENKVATEAEIEKLISTFPKDQQDEIRQNAQEFIAVQKGEKEVAVVQGQPVFSRDVQEDFERQKKIVSELFEDGDINDVERKASIEAIDATALADRQNKLEFFRNLPDYQKRVEGTTEEEAFEKYAGERKGVAAITMDYFSGIEQGTEGYVSMALEGQQLREALSEGNEDGAMGAAFQIINKTIEQQQQKKDPFQSGTAAMAGQVMGQVGAQITTQKGGELLIRGLSLVAGAAARSPALNQLGQQAAPWLAGGAGAVANANIYGLDWFQTTVQDFLETANVEKIDDLSDDQKKQLYKEAVNAFNASQLPSVTELVEPTMFINLPKAARKTTVGRVLTGGLNIAVETGQEKFTEEWKEAYLRNYVSAHQAQSTMGAEDLAGMALGLLPLGGAKFAVDTIRARRDTIRENKLKDLDKYNAARAEQLRAEQAAIDAAEQAAINAEEFTPESAGAMKTVVEAAKDNIDVEIADSLVRLPEQEIAQENQAVQEALIRIDADDRSQIFQDMARVVVSETIRPIEGLNQVTVENFKNDISYIENLINKNEFTVAELDKTQFKRFLSEERYNQFVQVVEENPQEAIRSVRELVDTFVGKLEVPVEAAGGGEEERRGVGVEPTVPVTPPVEPTPEGAVAPVEPVVEPVVAEPQPVAETLPETIATPEGERARAFYHSGPSPLTAETASFDKGAMGFHMGAKTQAEWVAKDKRKAEISSFYVRDASEDQTLETESIERDMSWEQADALLVELVSEGIVDKQEAIDLANSWGDMSADHKQALASDLQKVNFGDEYVGMDGNVGEFMLQSSTYKNEDKLGQIRQLLVDKGIGAIEYVNEVEGVGGNPQAVAIFDKRMLAEAPAAVTPPAKATPTPEATPETPNLEPLRRVARAEQTEEDVSGLVGQGLVELYNGQPVITQAGLEALPEAERPRLNPEARKIQIDTGSNEVVAEAISKNLRIGVDQVPFDVSMPAGWTIEGDIYVPPAPQEVTAEVEQPEATPKTPQIKPITGDLLGQYRLRDDEQFSPVKSVPISDLTGKQYFVDRKLVEDYKKRILAGEPIDPIIAKTDFTVLDGYHRSEALQELGFKELPVTFVEENDAQAREEWAEDYPNQPFPESDFNQESKRYGEWQAGASPAPEVRESRREQPVVLKNRFYSQLERTVAAKMPNVSSPEQLKAIIDPTRGSGVKPEEIKWSGITEAIDRIASENNGRVPKEAIIKYMQDEGRVKFEEVTLARKKVPYTGGEIKKSKDGKYYILSFLGYDNVYTKLEDAKADLQKMQEGMSRTDDATEYSKYQLPNGENYREVVLTIPKTPSSEEMTSIVPSGENIVVRGVAMRWDEAINRYIEKTEGDALIKTLNKFTKQQREDYISRELVPDIRIKLGATREESKKYKSPHFANISNYVAHMRLNDRKDADRKDGTFIEEIQSDLHQKAREVGYKDENIVQQNFASWLNANKKELSEQEIQTQFKTHVGEEIQQWLKDQEVASKNASAVPDAPFRKDWPIQMFKRALEQAVMSGKDWIGWTTGETQASRYDLSKRISKVGFEPNKKGDFSIGELYAYDLDNKLAIRERNIKPEQLADYIGKEAAEKLLQKIEEFKASPQRTGMRPPEISGLDLKVGGEGMAGFYDNILPKEIAKYVKKWGATVEKSFIGKSPSKEFTDAVERFEEAKRLYGAESQQATDAMMAIPSESGGEGVYEIWRVNITPEMRRIIEEEGQSLFSLQMPSRGVGMEPEAVATKIESLGFGRGGIVSVVNEPDASFEGRTIIRDGKVVGIELNAAALKDDAAIERVLNHEIAESANADGALNTLVAGLTPKERKEINDAITRLGYAEKARTAEEAARAVELLAEGWKGRKWFDRAVARVEAWANKLGYKLTRRAAEYIAARNVSEINDSFKQAYNKFITPSSQEGAVIRESIREDIAPDPDINEEGSNAETEAAITQRAEAKKSQELVTGHSILADEVPSELREEAQANYQNGMTLGDFLNPQFFNLGEAYNPYIAATWLELNGGLMPTVKVEGKEIAKPEKGTSEAEALRLLKRASDILDSRSETAGGKELTYSLQDIMATWMESGLGPAALKNAIVQFTNLDVAQADKTANDFARVYELAQNVTATKERARVRMDRALPAVTARQQREKERMIKLEEAAGSIDSIAEAIRIAYDIGIKKPKTDKATEKKQIEEQLRQAKQILRDVVPKQYLGDQLLTLERATGLEGLKKVVEAAQNGLNQARLDEAVAGAKKSLDRAQKAVKANEISPEAMAVLRDFVETYSKKGIGPETRAKIEDAINRYEADPVGALQDLATEKYLKQKGALGAIKIDKSLGLDALKEISRIINTTLHADKVARGEMLFNKQETRQEVITGISEEIDKVKSIAKARKDGGQGIGLFNKVAIYKGARVENILRAFGLNKLSEFVYDRLTLDAYQDELRVRRDLKKKIESRVKEITGLEIGTKDYDLYSKEVVELTGVDSAGRTKPIKVRRYELLDILASMRDPSNLKRAVNSGGYVIDRLDLAEVDTVKITPETYIEILNKATDQDNQMVDMMVDLYNNDLFQVLENASVQAYGHGIKAVSGTYYPRTADKWTRATEVKKDLDYIAYYQRRVDDVGYLKERDERSKSKLRAVDFLERLDYHVTNDARIGAYLPIVRDIEMVLGDPAIARPLASKIGEEGLNMIREMVRQQTTPPAGLKAGILSTLIGNAGVGVLGFKLHAAMQNPVGLPIALAYYGKDGVKYLAKAFPAGIRATKKGDRIEMEKILSQYAPYYNERYGDGGFIQEFTSGLSAAPSNRKWRKNLETASMSWLEASDKWGALVRYKLAQQVVQDRTTLESGTEEFNRAVAREWTKMMFRSENTAHGGDRTGVFQDVGRNPALKLFVMFQSAVSKQYSLFAEAMLRAQQGGKENLREATFQLGFLSLSLYISRAISNAFYSTLFPPEDDEEKTWGQFLGKAIGTPLSIVPVVGSFLQNTTEAIFSPENMRKPMQIDLVSSVLFGMYDVSLLFARAYGELSEEKIDEATGSPKFWETSYRAITKAGGLAGVYFGIPIGGVVQTAQFGLRLKERVGDVFSGEPKTEDFQKKIKEYEKEQRTEPVTQEYAKIFFAVTEDNQKEFNRALKDLKAKRPDLSRKDVINAIRRRPEFRVVGMVRSGKMKQKDLEANGISRDYYLTQKALLRATEEAAKTMYRDSKD